MNAALGKQAGVGLIEVMVALSVLMFAALSISNLQTNSHISMRISDSHFEINQLTQDMLELLRSNAKDAKLGKFDVSFDGAIVGSPSFPVLYAIGQWQQKVASQLPGGSSQIQCTTDACQVTLRWKENIDGTMSNQFFNIAGPI